VSTEQIISDIDEIDSEIDEQQLQSTVNDYVEMYVDEVSDGKYHFSVDTVEIKESHVRIDVYGLENYDLPEKSDIAEGVGDFMGWTPGYEEERSRDDLYSIRVVAWEE